MGIVKVFQYTSKNFDDKKKKKRKTECTEGGRGKQKL